MTQDILGVDTHRGGVGTNIDQRTSRTTLCLGQHTVGQSQRSQIEFGNIDVCRFETLIEVLVERLALKDVQEVTLNA